MLLLRLSGLFRLRLAQRTLLSLLLKAPPRKTRGRSEAPLTLVVNAFSCQGAPPTGGTLLLSPPAFVAGVARSQAPSSLPISVTWLEAW